MSFVDFLLLALAGKLVIYLAQKFPFVKLPFIGKLWDEGGFLAKLFGCDLCLGVWIYTIIALVFRVQPIYFKYIPLISEFIIGGATSFLVHTFSVGWNAEHKSIIINSWSE